MTLWRIDKRPTFLKQYGRLGHVRQLLVDDGIRELALSENPADLGDYKKSMKTFSYDLSKGDRIIFDVDYQQNMIILLRVCDHKSVCGKD